MNINKENLNEISRTQIMLKLLIQTTTEQPAKLKRKPIN